MTQVAKSKKMEMEISRLNDESTRQSTLSFQLRQGTEYNISFVLIKYINKLHLKLHRKALFRIGIYSKLSVINLLSLSISK